MVVCMKREEVLNLYDLNKLKKVINLCDNIFFGDFLETGVLQSRLLIQMRMRNEVAKTFIDYWGPDYAAIINRRIAGTEIAFAYQTDGPRNSIRDFLKSRKIHRFNQQNKTQFDAPEDFSYVDDLLMKNGNGQKQLENSIIFEHLLHKLGVSKEDFFRDPALAQSVKAKIHQYAKLWKDTTYSDDRAINNNMNFLHYFVCEVRQNMQKECMRTNTNFGEALYYSNAGMEMDPVVQAQNLGTGEKELLRESPAIAFYSGDKRTVFFGGTELGDSTVIHEFVHALTNTNLINREKEDENVADKEIPFAKYEMLNEVITDFLAVEIFKLRQQKQRSLIVSSESIESGYSIIYPILDKFFVKYLAAIKASVMSPSPMHALSVYMGKENLDRLAAFCNQIIYYATDVNLVKVMKKYNFKWDGVVAQVKQECLRKNKAKDCQENAAESLTKKVSQARGVTLTEQEDLILGRLLGVVSEMNKFVNNLAKGRTKRFGDKTRESSVIEK